MSAIPSLRPGSGQACTLPRAARPFTTVYRPRRPEKTVVYQLVQGHLETWLARVRERLRFFLQHDPVLIGPVLRTFLEAVEDRLKACSPGASAEVRFGAVAFVHRFGSALNANLHFHCAPISTKGNLLTFRYGITWIMPGNSEICH
jgi:hypothetical protein